MYLTLSAEVFIPLYKAMVRSHFDYAMIIWNPHAVKYIESIEGVQRRATKMVPELKKLSYPESTVGNTTVFHGRYSLFHTVGPIRSHSSHIFSSCVTRMWQMITSFWSPAPTYPM